MNKDQDFFIINKKQIWNFHKKARSVMLKKIWVNNYIPKNPIQTKKDLEKELREFKLLVNQIENNPESNSQIMLQVFDLGNMIGSKCYAVQFIETKNLLRKHIYEVERRWQIKRCYIINGKANGCDHKVFDLIEKYRFERRYFLIPIIDEKDIYFAFLNRAQSIQKTFQEGQSK